MRQGKTVIETDEGLDVSAVGVSIRTDARLPIGSTCTVEILLAKQMGIEAQGVVARDLDDGFAIQITEIGLSAFELLKNLIRFNSDDPDLVEQQFDEHLGLRAR